MLGAVGLLACGCHRASKGNGDVTRVAPTALFGVAAGCGPTAAGPRRGGNEPSTLRAPRDRSTRGVKTSRDKWARPDPGPTYAAGSPVGCDE